MQQVLLIVCGWLLGLLSPAIVEQIRKNYRRAELTAAILVELHELQYKVALVAYRLNCHNQTLTDEFLNWIERIVINYKGPNPKDGMLEMIAGLQKAEQDQRARVLAFLRKPGKGVGMVQYSLSFIDAHLGEIALYPIPFQMGIVHIREQLNMYNQRIVIQQRYLEKTFDSSLSDDNRAAIVDDLESGYLDLAGRTRQIADAIAALPDAKRKRLTTP